MKRRHVCCTWIEGPIVGEIKGIQCHTPTFWREDPRGELPAKDEANLSRRRFGRTYRFGRTRAGRQTRSTDLLCMHTDFRRRSTPCIGEVGASEGSAEPPGSAEPVLARLGFLLRQVTSPAFHSINMRWGGQNRAPILGYQTRNTLS